MNHRLFVFVIVQIVVFALVGAVLVVNARSEGPGAVPPVTGQISLGSPPPGSSNPSNQASTTLDPLSPVGSGFTLQGRLTQSGNPVNGQYDLRFTLYDASFGGNQVGSPITLTNQTVTDGLFTVRLDFGSTAFQGQARFIDLAVRPTGGGGFTTLSPRVETTGAPYALSLVPGATITGTETFGNSLVTVVDNGYGNGVYGQSTGGNGVYGQSSTGYGVYGSSQSGNGVVGQTNSGNSSRFAIGGFNDGAGYGVYGHSSSGNGVGGYSTSLYGSGVYGQSNTGYGVYASSQSGYGVYAISNGAAIPTILAANNGTGDGVWGLAQNGIGVYGQSNSGYAGYFSGNVQVIGNLSKGGGSFKIDHPLDPANKYLYHSFVESPDMMDIYNGNITTDAKGEAWVTMASWFETLNRDFRYQLTSIGASGPNLYIAQEIQGNRFKIAGGTPGLKVSWQVTGVRHDPYAEKYRIPVEQDKPADERGYYLHPELYGQPDSKRVNNVQTGLQPNPGATLPGSK